MVLVSLKKIGAFITKHIAENQLYDPYAERHISLVTILVEATNIESFINNAIEAWPLEIDKYEITKNKKFRRKGLKELAEEMLTMAKDRMSRLKLKPIETDLILKKIDEAFPDILMCVDIRHQVAHGKTMFALKDKSDSEIQSVSDELQNMNTDRVAELDNHIWMVLRFCDLILCPISEELGIKTERHILSDVLGIQLEST